MPDIERENTEFGFESVTEEAMRQVGLTVPIGWVKAKKEIAKLGKMLREDAISKAFSPEAEYSKQLDIITGWYEYVVTEYMAWVSLKENNEAAKFYELKEGFKPKDEKDKFTAATANGEASHFVATERFYRNILEGMMKSAEQSIMTLKKHIKTERNEEGFTKGR